MRSRASRRADRAALIVFALLVALAWHERGRFVAIFGPPERDPAQAVEPETGIRPEAAPGGGADPRPPAAPAIGVPPGAQRDSEAGETGSPTASAPTPVVPASDPVARILPSHEADAKPPSPPAALPGDDVVVGHTTTGLRTYALPAPPPPIAAADPLALALEAAAGPDEAGAFDAALVTLVDLGRDDEALEAYVVALEAGLSDEEPRAGLDPFAPRKAALLEAAAGRLVSQAELAAARGLWLVALRSLDQARALLDGARLEGGLADGDVATRLEQRRATLLKGRGALDALARAGVALPGQAIPGSRLRADADARRDEGALRDDRLHEESSRHAVVVTALPVSLARVAGRVVDLAHERACERFGCAPSGFDRLRVELLDDESTLETRRLRASPTPSAAASAWLTTDHAALVALDPRTRGDDLTRLWADLSREVTRRVLLRSTGTSGPAPPWLVVGLSVQAEALRLDDDRGFVRTPLPRRRQVVASLAGRGLPALGLEDVLAGDGRDPDTFPWAWALVAWLDEGAPGLPGRHATPRPLDALIDAWREGSSAQPQAQFRLTVLPRAGGAALSMRDAQGAFERWIEGCDALWRGDDESLRREIVRAREALDARQLALAVDRLELLLDARPGDVEVLALAVDVARACHREDIALVYAAGLGAARARPSDSPPPEERFAEALAVSAIIGGALVANDRALRDDAATLVDDLIAEGFPLAAVRLLDRLLAADPLDAQWTARRRRIVDEGLGRSDPVATRRIDLDPRGPGRRGDLSAWHLDDGVLVTGSADRIDAVTLRGLGEVEADRRLSLDIEFMPGPAGQRHADDGHVFAGLLLGAESPVEQGSWGVFLTPSGEVVLARRGGLEWPGQVVGRAPRGATRLQVETRGDRLLLTAGDRELGQLDLGVRPAAGWIALYVRRADVRLSGLRVSSSRATDPRSPWFTRGLL